MGMLKWVVGLLAMSASTLLAEEKAAQLSIAVLVGMVVFCRRSKIPGRNLERRFSPATEVNDSLYELYRPVGVLNMQVIFFHGLPLGDFSKAHLSTWESGDGSCIWPQTWLAEEFPDAQILSVSYSEGMKKGSVGSFDMSIISENLILDLMQGKMGEMLNCPIVLVGHCFGGLVIKQLCLQAHDKLHMVPRSEKAKLESFLDNVKGIFYYGTPHFGSPNLAKAAEEMGSPLFEYIKILSTEAMRMNSRFDQLHQLYPEWQVHGLGENKKTRLGPFRDVLLVPEASARVGEIFQVLATDHYSICKPQKKTSTSFSALVRLLDSIVRKRKEEMHEQVEARAHEGAQPQNLQLLPKEALGIDFLLEQVRSKLVNATTMGLVGMGGVGKTTLAKAIFNGLNTGFEYSCFVPNMKLIKGTGDVVKEEIWKYMHCKGRKIGNECKWSRLEGKQLLLVMDDISDRDVTILSDIAKDCSLESRFIITSRDHELLKGLEDTYEVPFLQENDSKQLFISHAFPNGAIRPLKLRAIMVDVVKKCGGLPLALEVLGRYLRKKEDYKYWKQALQALDKGEAVSDLNKRLWAVLRLSYDDLQETEQMMFLDATTFFNSGRFLLHEAKAAWRKAYETDCESLFWQTLVDRSLVTNVEECEKIRVHEQVQSLGRMIAKECSKHSSYRVWEEPMTLRILQTPDQVETKEFHSLQMESSSRTDKNVLHVASLALQKIKHARFLNINSSVVIDGSQEDDSSLHELVVLNCVGIDIFNLALQSRLVVLKLSIPGVENLPASIGQLSSLEIFVVSDAENLESLPDDIGNLSQLEYLELGHCTSLQNLPETFGRLSKLKHLQFLECGSLLALPKSFRRLSALEHLFFLNCVQLHSLPEEFGALTGLMNLEFNHCEKLTSLPNSFGDLSALSQLSFKCCCLESLPESFGRLSTLTELEITECEDMWCLVPFGQLMKLEYLKISGDYDFGERESLPESLGELVALGHLVIDSVSVKSIPDYIKDLSSLHTLELDTLPYVKVLPAWLGNAGVIPLALSRKIFQKQEGCFSLSLEKDSISSDRLIKLLHSNAMKKVGKGRYERALADLCPGDLGEMELKWKGFLLQERGILKRQISQKRSGHFQDLHGALEDLTAALEVFSEANDLQHYAYDCWKHRGFLNSLLGELDIARNDGGMALMYLSRYSRRSVMSSRGICLGDESLVYTNFTLKGVKEMTKELEDSAHSQVMEKVRAGDFPTALAIWNALEVKVSGYHNRVYFFQERGILRRMTGDLDGAFEDLTAALEIDEDDYACLKNLGYVKHLLKNEVGARADAERCKKMKGVKYEREFLGALPVEFLGFELT